MHLFSCQMDCALWELSGVTCGINGWLYDWLNGLATTHCACKKKKKHYIPSPTPQVIQGQFTSSVFLRSSTGTQVWKIHGDKVTLGSRRNSSGRIMIWLWSKRCVWALSQSHRHLRYTLKWRMFRESSSFPSHWKVHDATTRPSLPHISTHTHTHTLPDDLIVLITCQDLFSDNCQPQKVKNGLFYSGLWR